MNKETLANKIQNPFSTTKKIEIFERNIPVKDVKEFIKFEKLRRENQLRIHWNWLKDKSYKEVVKFLNVMTDKRAGEGLVK